MRHALHDLWGCGAGPVTKLAPSSRIVAGALVLASCTAAPTSTTAGAALIGCLVASWILACRPPWHVVRGAAALGLSLFLPYALLLPLGGVDPRQWSVTWPVVVSVLLHGLAGVLVSVSTAATLTPTDLREGLTRLPIPRLASAVLTQIVHQTATLGDETRSVASAMAVRGASGGGFAVWRVLASLPQVWLPRVILRAERVAAAMELRGYCEQAPAAPQPHASGHLDKLALASLLAALALAFGLRYGAAW